MRVYLKELHILSSEGSRSRSSFKVKRHIGGHCVSQTHLVFYNIVFFNELLTFLQLYDLYTGPYSKGENHANGCAEEEEVCGVNSLDSPKCGPYGSCALTDLTNSQYKCTCRPGYRDQGSKPCSTGR
ncbi:hypothetical protein DPMN_169418 [Dreissena polymorpha]|uniref:EGF-like domain-containing protein n=1 Tax=Dreissena polymorpha TaxID=45954 RepID=A0A9D4DWH8_DREPO|nr:hypothetical protein DPMN_169418 [Dreissena polymorpha]